jgi:septal ring factor EnvC (AmiA/AmiB activator)
MALLLLAARPAFADSASTPAASERQADLDRLQRRIAVLKGKLAESDKKAATLADELQRLELRLEIATREGELVAATRVEFAGRLEAVTQERAAAGPSPPPSTLRAIRILSGSPRGA